MPDRSPEEMTPPSKAQHNWTGFSTTHNMSPLKAQSGNRVLLEKAAFYWKRPVDGQGAAGGR